MSLMHGMETDSDRGVTERFLQYNCTKVALGPSGGKSLQEVCTGLPVLGKRLRGSIRRPRSGTVHTGVEFSVSVTVIAPNGPSGDRWRIHAGLCIVASAAWHLHTSPGILTITIPVF